MTVKQAKAFVADLTDEQLEDLFCEAKATCLDDLVKELAGQD